MLKYNEIYIWYIPKQLFHLLYMNKIPVKDREVFLQTLIDILKTKNFYRSLSEYFHFIQLFKKLGFNDVVSFIENSMSEVFHDEKDWNNKKNILQTV